LPARVHTANDVRRRTRPDRNHADAAIEAHQRSLSAGRERKQQGGRKQTSRECLFHDVLPYKLKSKTTQGTTPPAEPLFRYRVQIFAEVLRCANPSCDKNKNVTRGRRIRVNPASCRRKYVREEALEAQFTELLGRLKFDDEVLEWVRDALHASHADERHDHEEAIRRHQAEYNRLNDRIHAMYVDKLDGLVDTAFFEKMSNQWREDQSRCQREIERHQNADKSYLEEGVQLLDLARNAQRLFATQQPREKRRLPNFLLSNCTWENGEVVATFREPFDMLAETAANSNRLESGLTFKSAKTEIWLGN
jgi:hypothetical protein